MQNGKAQYFIERQISSGEQKTDHTLLSKWKTKSGIVYPEQFELCLNTLNLTNDEFAALIMKKEESAKCNEEWCNYYERILAHEAEYSIAYDIDSDISKVFSPFVKPFISWAQTKTVKYINIRNEDNYLDVKGVIASFSRYLHEHLSFIALKTLILELNISSYLEQLQGETKKERYQYFIENSLTNNEDIKKFFIHYPVLARVMTERTLMLIKTFNQMIKRFIDDYQGLTIFSQGSVIKTIEFGMGDTHKNGEAVHIIQFQNGKKAVYKPRSIAVDESFQNLLSWINQKGLKHPLKSLKVISRKNYGWMEFIDYKDCESIEELERFYYRQGALIGLLYILNAGDFHYENIIANGEHPMLVDLEVLFQNEVTIPARKTAVHEAIKNLSSSVLKTMMLPVQFSADKVQDGVDVSGIGGRGGQEVTHNVFMIKDIYTDQMKLVKGKGQTSYGKNVPRLKTEKPSLEDYKDPLQQGFNDLYTIMLEHKDVLLSPNGPLQAFNHAEVRVVLRSTQIYHTFLETSYHPDYLQNGLDREWLFMPLWNTGRVNKMLNLVIPYELQDLLAGDIPYFTAKPNSTSIWTSQQEEIKNFYQTTGRTLVDQNIRKLSLKDLNTQLEYIEMSLATLKKDKGEDTPIDPVLLEKGQVNKERFKEEAIEIGNLLCKRAIYGEGQKDATWIGISKEHGADARLSPLHYGLYDGILGISLFLGYLGRSAKNEKYTDSAKRAFQMVKDRIKHPANDDGISVFTGWGSILLSLCHFQKLWNLDNFEELACEVIGHIEKQIDYDRRYDIMSGSAGVIFALLNFYDLTKSMHALQAAIKCGNHLMKHKTEYPEGIGWVIPGFDRPLNGLSHGGAGIAWALQVLADKAGRPDFQEASLQAVQYENSWYSAEDENWSDHRQGPNDIPVFWCNGAAGIGISRLMMKGQGNPLFERDIQRAINKTLKDGFGRGINLCHGDMGNIELLLLAAEKENRQDLREIAENMAASVLEQKRKSADSLIWDGHIPGFMTGLSGIGYQLLRLHDPDSVPSLLSLQLGNLEVIHK